MNISNSSVSFSSQVSASQSRPQGPPPGKGEEQLSSALESIGVDDSTAAKVLQQIDTAITALQSESSSGVANRTAVQSAVNEVLEANGIDAAEVGEAIQASNVSSTGQASGASGPGGVGGAERGGKGSRAGRGQGPPPPRQDEEDTDTNAVESALLSTGIDESTTEDLIDQMIETLQELSSESSDGASIDEVRSALTSLFEENGVDFDQFEQALSEQFGAAGSFIDRLV